jgi:heme oxygenase
MQPPEMGAEEQRRQLKDALLASAQIAGEAKAWERGKRAGQRGIMPPGTDVGAATRARGPEWRRFMGARERIHLLLEAMRAVVEAATPM